MDKITHEITLDSDLTEEPRERLLEIANHCPVHRALTNGVLVLVLTTEPYERVPLVSRRTTKINTILKRSITPLSGERS